jgi:hypothetical protein
MTYYTSLNYTNYTCDDLLFRDNLSLKYMFSLVTDWYVAGNEIADHT